MDRQVPDIFLANRMRMIFFVWYFRDAGGGWNVPKAEGRLRGF
jgi:hypothetical protein